MVPAPPEFSNKYGSEPVPGVTKEGFSFSWLIVITTLSLMLSKEPSETPINSV